MTNRSDLACPFRRDIQTDENGESARCDFLARLTGASDEFCRVDRSACEICVEHPPLSPAAINPVMPSLIFGVCESAFPDRDANSPASLLQNWATSAVATDGMAQAAPVNYGCDFIIVFDENVEPNKLVAFATTLIYQDGVQSLVHLVSVDEQVRDDVTEFAKRPNVRLHVLPQASNWAGAVNLLCREFKTQLLAPIPLTGNVEVAELRDLSIVQKSIDQLEENGSEILAGWIFENRLGNDEPFLLFRRGAYAELDGFDPDTDQPVIDFLQRARRQGHTIVGEEIGQPNTYCDPPPVVRFMTPRPTCDVVLPFRDSLELVEESLKGLLAQVDADVTIHLVDDASRISVDEFFANYRDHENVRFYRNQKNIGPFASFNNIALIGNSEYIAVQDADDISLPNRVSRSCHLLSVTGTDILGSRTELFGATELCERVSHEQLETESGQQCFVRNSRYPRKNSSGYFMENPTLVMRRSSFIAMGGYGDFGEGPRNRTGVDTDFQVRSHFSRAAMITTRDILVRYRCHGESATIHSETGFGSQARLESDAEVHHRFMRYCTGTFDPRWYGALRSYEGITKTVQP